jgi:AmmeMemoRadiSam system protein B/AmmeMemoRadiSam system protein A
MQAAHISPFAGSWYPENATELERLLDERFAQSCRRTGPFLPGDALAFVTPHAGPAYSGTVAAAVYRAIRQQRPERIVVLAFPHHASFGGIGIPDVEAIATPLGEVQVDAGFAGAFPRVAEAQVCDHSFEIQLPFLQRAAPRARVSPLYVGHMDADERRRAAGTLAAAWQPGVVFLASSDFTHYGRSFGYTPFPADGAVSRRLRELDFECIDAAGSLDSSLFMETLREHDATVCGRDPIALLLDVMDKLDGDGTYQSVLDYQTSGEITGDYHHSVSYAALEYSRRDTFDLNAADRQALLDAAGETLRRLRESGARDAVPARGGSLALEARRGLFVSLHQGGELLGCIGNCSGRDTLAVLAGELALAAALDDPRFQPAAEVAGPIDLEISVLTPFRRIRGAEQFCAGRHGAVLKLGGRSGLLLPQVAEEHGWTAGEFFDALARKSLAGPRAWMDPQARLYAFEAQVFSSLERAHQKP